MTDNDFEVDRRSMMTVTGLIALGLFDTLSSIFDDEEMTFVVDKEEDIGDYDEDEFDVFIANDTGAIYVEDEESGGWRKLETTGEDQVLNSLDVGSLFATERQTRNVGVSANIGTDQIVPTGAETRLEIDNTSGTWFDDFDELDTENHEVIVGHGERHTDREADPDRMTRDGVPRFDSEGGLEVK